MKQYPCPAGRPHAHWMGASYTCSVKPQPAPEHHCDLDFAQGGHGSAITELWEDDGHFWVGNGGYASQVNYCPVCGEKAPRPAEPWTPRPSRFGWMVDKNGSKYWGSLVPVPGYEGSVPWQAPE